MKLHKKCKHLKYLLVRYVKRIHQDLLRQTIGKIIFRKALYEIQHCPIFRIYKYPKLLDYKILSPYKTTKLFVEAGIGNGEQLAYLANYYTRATVIGFEITNKYVIKSANRLKRHNCKNAKIIHGDIMETLAKFFADAVIDRCYITCPDPWPKRKHIKHRLVYFENFKIILSKIKPKGTIQIITDNVIYQNTLVNTLKQLNNQVNYVNQTYKTLPVKYYKTKYIKKWEQNNRNFYVFEIEKS